MRTNLAAAALNSQWRTGICNALRVTSNAGANSRMPQTRTCKRSSFRRFEIGERTSGGTGDDRAEGISAEYTLRGVDPPYALVEDDLLEIGSAVVVDVALLDEYQAAPKLRH
jgi:hypothetical protein